MPRLRDQKPEGKKMPNFSKIGSSYQKMLHKKALKNHKNFEKVTKTKEENGWKWMISHDKKTKILVHPNRITLKLEEGFSII